MHNNIMAAGSKERPPMLGPGRYSQWHSRFLRYLDTKTNGEYLRKCIFDGPYLPTNVLKFSVVNQKHDELVKKSLLTRSQFEGQLKEKSKVISDLKVKEGKDIDTMIEMDKQIKFLNEILYKRNQSIQTIHMLAPKRNQSIQTIHIAFPNPTAKTMEVLIKTLLMPLSNKTILDSHCFVHELKKEMNDDLEYVKSLEKEMDELESEKADFSNMYDLLLEECVSKDVTCSYLHSLSDLNANTDLMYFEKNVNNIMKYKI
ncbi:hypothetical protein Tco_1269937 [Tanacetum coccineum]